MDKIKLESSAFCFALTSALSPTLSSSKYNVSYCYSILSIAFALSSLQLIKKSKDNRIIFFIYSNRILSKSSCLRDVFSEISFCIHSSLPVFALVPKVAINNFSISKSLFLKNTGITIFRDVF